MQTIHQLKSSFNRAGTLQWIGIRPAREATMLEPQQVILDAIQGIIGDRYQGRSGKRQVTLIQAEHLPVIASYLDLEMVDPKQLRRNLLVSGINLLALKDQYFKVGSTLLLGTGLCHPCSKMQTTFGAGGYNAVRGNGGITAQVIEGGEISLGNQVIHQADVKSTIA